MRVRPLTLIAFGVVLVTLDFRVVALDVLPDALGWALVALGAGQLHRNVPAGLATVAALSATLDLIAPHHREAIDPITGRIVTDVQPGEQYPERLVFDRLTDGRLLLAVLGVLAGGAALWLLLTTLRDRARVGGDDGTAGRLDLLRWLVALLWAAPYVGLATYQAIRHEGFDPVWNGGLEPLALCGIAVAGATAWVLRVHANRQWAIVRTQRGTSSRANRR